MDGGQVGKGERPVQLLFAHLEFPRIDDDRHRGSNALIAAAGVDDHRLLAAVHPGIGACGRVGLGPHPHIIALHVQQDAADVGPVITPEAFFGNGHVVPDLRV